MTRTSRRVPERSQALGLRARVVVVFSLAGFVLSLGLAVFTYLFARDRLLEQRDELALTATYSNARLVRDVLQGDRSSPADALELVRPESGGFAFVRTGSNDVWYPQNAVYDPGSIPEELRDSVSNGSTARQRYELGDEPYLAVGVALPSVDAEYFETFPLESINRTLGVILTSLAIGVGATTLAAAALGWSVSRRLLRPLSRVADAASELASGGLDTRLESEPDPDLNRLVTSFNDMADAVQSRIERETRFASDVSHELRSPITALSAAVDVLATRRNELPTRSQQALDVVVNQVDRFDHMVLDLLELSRIDAGVEELVPEAVVLPDAVRRIANRAGHPDVPVHATGRALAPVAIDKRRLERIVVNLVDNADRHAGGPVDICLEDGEPGTIHLVVDDAGPGVPVEERQRVFERFYRGTAGRARVGTGLGLALVAEHAHALDGQTWVEDRDGGGSRFVVSVPVVEP